MAQQELQRKLEIEARKKEAAEKKSEALKKTHDAHVTSLREENGRVLNEIN